MSKKFMVYFRLFCYVYKPYLLIFKRLLVIIFQSKYKSLGFIYAHNNVHILNGRARGAFSEIIES